MIHTYDATYIRWVKDLDHKYERRHLYDTHIWLSYIDHLIKKMFLHVPVYDPHMNVPYITLIYEPQMITSTKDHIHMIHTYDTHIWYTYVILIYSYFTNNFIYMIHIQWSHIWFPYMILIYEIVQWYTINQNIFWYMVPIYMSHICVMITVSIGFCGVNVTPFVSMSHDDKIVSECILTWLDHIHKMLIFLKIVGS